MREFIAENAKFVIDYGQYILFSIILICIIAIYLIVRKNKYYLPKGIFSWIASILFILIILFMSISIFGLQQEKSTTGLVLNQFESMVGKQAPELTFNHVGTDVPNTLSEFEGKVVLLNLWATWCQPCIEEMPDLNRLYLDYKDRGLIVIALSDERKEVLLNYLDNHKYTFLNVYNRQIEWINIRIGAARPITFLIDRNGIIVDYYTGARDYEFFESKIKELL